MGQTSILQIHTNPTDFVEEVAEAVFSRLKPIFEKAAQAAKDDPRPLTRREAATYLGISLTTLTDRENKGLVKGYRTGNRRLYRREDLDASLQSVRRTAGRG